MSEEAKTLQALSILVQEPGVLQRLYAHILMEDPAKASKERFEQDKRIERLEELIVLMQVKKNSAHAIQQLINEKTQEIQSHVH